MRFVILPIKDYTTRPTTSNLNIGWALALCCQGDSGGPLACKDQQDRWTVIGINSFGFDYCAQSVVARVSTYINWIHQTISSYP